MKNFKNKKITVIGLGRSGLAAAELLNKLGAQVKITEYRENNRVKALRANLGKIGIEVKLGHHCRHFIKGADLVVSSPGVSPDSPPLLWAKEMKIPVLGEMEIAARFINCPIIAVTGTNGKTTTVSLLGEMLKKNYKIEIAGNIGRPLSQIVFNLTSKHLLILEVSSFQLERIKYFRPKISIILNITPDHLDRYQNFGEYLSVKKRIFLNQQGEDYAIFPARSPFTKLLQEEIKCRSILFGSDLGSNSGIFYQDSFIYSNLKGSRERILNAENLKLKGEHNRENIMASLAVVSILGADLKFASKTIRDFPGLTHRLEWVCAIDNVTFINDSKSTNVDSLIKAVRSFSSIILIAGGRDKGADFTPLRAEMENKVKEIILFGEAKEKLKEIFQNTKPLHLAENLEEAVNLSWKLSRGGDTVLFSPGCSSFDMFKNFEERGKVFKKIVAALNDTRPGERER